MRTKMDYSSLGEAKSTYSNTPRSSSTYSHVGKESGGNKTHSSVREPMHQPQMQQRTVYSSGNRKASSSDSHGESSGTLGVAMGLLAGAGVGVLAGILMAPDSGRITRRRLSDSAAWVGRGINEKLGVGKTKIDSWVGKEESLKDAADNLKNRNSGEEKF
ncbi:YtxH domain-containing protein [Pontibacter sp. HSC-14F20]|uniref:YtxH domain-containing protein n=1 Tax=Pontibacter sp. HSC-14F20 TaxID=2864136 RepID=UPI001C7369A9|nr:YtxH domain-containing protein [Pontibacter sp. HSC-14F20]MBX0332799.1 YtxH domain-containing protein [Pontibacter sp. HSC-14F20]